MVRPVRRVCAGTCLPDNYYAAARTKAVGRDLLVRRRTVAVRLIKPRAPRQLLP
jgi:hypothetical protein